jgi:hypothetical protein
MKFLIGSVALVVAIFVDSSAIGAIALLAAAVAFVYYAFQGGAQ